MDATSHSWNTLHENIEATAQPLLRLVLSSRCSCSPISFWSWWHNNDKKIICSWLFYYLLFLSSLLPPSLMWLKGISIHVCSLRRMWMNTEGLENTSKIEGLSVVDGIRAQISRKCSSSKVHLGAKRVDDIGNTNNYRSQIYSLPLQYTSFFKFKRIWTNWFSYYFMRK